MSGRMTISKRGVDDLVRRNRVGRLGRKALVNAVREYTDAQPRPRRSAIHCPECRRFTDRCTCQEHLRVRFAAFIDGIINLIGAQRGIEKAHMLFRAE